MAKSVKKVTNQADLILGLILHPIRWRIVQAFIGRSQLSARQVCEILVDVPPASVYRHFQKLAQAEFITVVSEKPVRGTMEKFYALQEEDLEVPTDELSKLTHEDHRRYFSLFVMSLLSDFDRYLQQETIDLRKDGVKYDRITLNLSPEERKQLAESLRDALQPFLQKQLTKKRKRFSFSTIVLPGE
jgi:DNA-binding transcriptional ArsR family regulator